MRDIEGVYRVEVLGPYGWEGFSTAFFNGGRYQSASAEHFSAGRYEVKGKDLRMTGTLTQHTRHHALFGKKKLDGLPITFKGKIQKGTIDGEARTEGRFRPKLRFRFNKLPTFN